MADFNNTIDVFGDDLTIDRYLTGELVEFSDDVLTELGDFAFTYCTKLTSVNLPNVTSMKQWAFYECTNLLDINLPNLTTLTNGSHFASCKKLQHLYLPKLENASDYMCNYCYELLTVNLPSLKEISGSLTFGGCSKLVSITLPATPPTLKKSGGLNHLPKTCILYIPKGSYTAYQAATNWSTLTETYTFQEEDI